MATMAAKRVHTRSVETYAQRGKRLAKQDEYGSAGHRISPLGSKLADNWKKSFLTSDSWVDMLWAVAGGAFYVFLPTIIQRIGVTVNPPEHDGDAPTYTVKWWDINGWPMLAIGAGGGMLFGGLAGQPGFMAGALGTAIAHLIFTKGNVTLVEPLVGIYAARLDASSTSTMGYVTPIPQPQYGQPNLQPGAERGMLGGRPVVLYPHDELPPSVTVSAAPALNDVMPTTAQRRNEQSAPIPAQRIEQPDQWSMDAALLTQ